MPPRRHPRMGIPQPPGLEPGPVPAPDTGHLGSSSQGHTREGVWAHASGGETEAQRSKGTHPKLHGWEGPAGFELSSLGFP